MRQGARVAQRERKLCLAKARDDGGEQPLQDAEIELFKYISAEHICFLRNLISFGSVQANC